VLLLVQQLPGLIRGGGPQVRVELNITKDLKGEGGGVAGDREREVKRGTISTKHRIGGW